MTIATGTGPDATELGLAMSYDEFLEYLRDPDRPGPVLSPKRFSAALHIDLQSLAEQAHVHRNTISRSPGSAGVQQFLRDALKVIKAGIDISGDVSRALFWYRNDPLPAFGYKTAEELVAQGRTEDVLRYTALLKSGAAE
jgi:hypothetical protein